MAKLYKKILKIWFIYFNILFCFRRYLRENVLIPNINQIFTFCNNFVDSVSILERMNQNNGIWNLIDNLIEDPLNMKNIGYKDLHTIFQLISLLNNNNLFCF